MSALVRRKAGYTVLELLIAITITGVALSSAIGVLIHQQRFYLLADDISETLDELGRVEMRLVPELLPLSPEAGDIIFAGSDSITARMFRGVYTVCGITTGSGVRVTLRALSKDGPPINADSALVYLRGSSPSLADDQWRPVRILSLAPGTCVDGTPGWTAEVPGLGGLSSQIPVGSPVRAFRHASYWLELRSNGWYVKTNATNGSPMMVAGPMTPPDSTAPSTLQFRYFDDEGDATTTPSEIARIDVFAAAAGEVPVTRGGKPYQTGRNLSFKIRNH